jgi:hypothetical protein
MVQLIADAEKLASSQTIAKPNVSGSAFSQEEEAELQRLVRKIKYNQPTIDDMEKADELTRKKWKSQGIG